MHRALHSRVCAVVLAATSVVLAGLIAGCAGSEASGPASNVASAVAVPEAATVLTDEQASFLAALGGSLTGYSTEAALTIGERVCSAYAEGRTTLAIRQVLTDRGLDEAQVSRTMLGAVSTLCREYRERPAA